MDAYQFLMKLPNDEELWRINNTTPAVNVDIDASDINDKVMRLINEFEVFMNDDFSTARVLANLFELVPVINSIKDRSITADHLSFETLSRLKEKVHVFVEDILGLKPEMEKEVNKLTGVMDVLIELRKAARIKKDWATSDKIRNQLAEIGISLKDEKDGNISWTLEN